MPLEDLLLQSLQLLGLGMGAVFIILILLIALISIVARLLPEEKSATAATPAAAQAVDPNHVAAISAAIHQYRKNRT